MSAPITEVKRPTFFAYLLALFLPPLYFFSRKRIVAGIVSLILLVISIPLLFLFGIGFFVWLFDAAWAIWNLRHEMLEAHIQDQANRIAKAMKEEKAA